MGGVHLLSVAPCIAVFALAVPVSLPRYPATMLGVASAVGYTLNLLPGVAALLPTGLAQASIGRGIFPPTLRIQSLRAANGGAFSVTFALARMPRLQILVGYVRYPPLSSCLLAKDGPQNVLQRYLRSMNRLVDPTP